MTLVSYNEQNVKAFHAIFAASQYDLIKIARVRLPLIPPIIGRAMIPHAKGRRAPG